MCGPGFLLPYLLAPSGEIGRASFGRAACSNSPARAMARSGMIHDRQGGACGGIDRERDRRAVIGQDDARAGVCHWSLPTCGGDGSARDLPSLQPRWPRLTRAPARRGYGGVHTPYRRRTAARAISRACKQPPQIFGTAARTAAQPISMGYEEPQRTAAEGPRARSV